MVITKIKRLAETELCVDSYIMSEKHQYIPASREASLRRLKELVRRQKYVRVCRDTENGEILAWIAADVSEVLHFEGLVFQQLYYGSICKGLKAIRCLEALHEDMYMFAAKNTKASYCISGCNPSDSKQIFTRLLERCGWERHTYLAIRKIR